MRCETHKAETPSSIRELGGCLTQMNKPCSSTTCVLLTDKTFPQWSIFLLPAHTLSPILLPNYPYSPSPWQDPQCVARNEAVRTPLVPLVQPQAEPGASKLPCTTEQSAWDWTAPLGFALFHFRLKELCFFGMIQDLYGCPFEGRGGEGCNIDPVVFEGLRVCVWPVDPKRVRQILAVLRNKRHQSVPWNCCH